MKNKRRRTEQRKREKKERNVEIFMQITFHLVSRGYLLKNVQSKQILNEN